jgi:hypothetical protein
MGRITACVQVQDRDTLFSRIIQPLVTWQLRPYLTKSVFKVVVQRVNSRTNPPSDFYISDNKVSVDGFFAGLDLCETTS